MFIRRPHNFALFPYSNVILCKQVVDMGNALANNVGHGQHIIVGCYVWWLGVCFVDNESGKFFFVVSMVFGVLLLTSLRGARGAT